MGSALLEEQTNAADPISPSRSCPTQLLDLRNRRATTRTLAQVV